ncbi:hypothetical protein LguiA_011820 [Lonicera macranthoides]
MDFTFKGQKSLVCGPLPTAIFLSAAFFIGSAFIVTDYKERFPGWQMIETVQHAQSKLCENQCRPDGSEALPKGIVSATSNFEMHPLWGSPNKRVRVFPPVYYACSFFKKNSKSPTNLLAMAVGKKQKRNVNEIVRKFPSTDFVVMLFHYDGIVDEWRDFEWSSRAIHVSAINQTKWWFAKRFLHPDVVSEYAYIFLWDEDLGVENFNAGRYLSIIKEEGLHISQPALDPNKSEVHHQITFREEGQNVHRRIYKRSISGKICNANSTDPPCTGWVEMMAPVFSKAAWRCAWYMIQNDLIHAWGLDMQLGYCAQGNRSQNIGIVDSEYVVHFGLPTRGGSAEASNHAAQDANLPSEGSTVLSTPSAPSARDAVRKQSLAELEIFKRRWRKAVEKDECWSDPYQKPVTPNS